MSNDYPDVPILWGDDEHDDTVVIGILFRGGAAYDMRSSMMIKAPTLGHLPPGVYRMCECRAPAKPGPKLHQPS